MIFSDSLAQVLMDAIETRLADLHVCMPGQIVSYDSSKQIAVVQPCFQRKFQDGTLVTLPQIANVPVVHPRANNAYIHLPLKAGDSVLLLFSERSLDQWLSKGGVVDPQDPRKHQLSDAFAIPGGYPTSSPATPANGTDLILSNSQASIQIQPSGTFLFKGASGQELLSILDQLLQTLISAQVNTMMGPQPFLPTVVSTLNQIKSNLDALKGS